MNVSIVIAAYNEGRDLLTTVAHAYSSNPEPYEIIVVDDCSDEPIADRLGSFPGVNVVRTPERLGAGPAKRFGVTRSSGDLVIVLDAHMRMPQGWLGPIKLAAENHPYSIFCCACSGFELHNQRQLLGGASFARRGDSFAIGISWLPRGPITQVEIIPCVLGACYIIPRPIWRELGGWNPNLYGWGFEEQDLSLRSWLSGFQVRRINEVIVGHRFDRDMRGYFMNSWEASFNQLVMTYSLFEDGVFEKIYHPFLKQLSPLKALERFEKEFEDIKTFRAKIQSNRRYGDDELESLCGFRLPTLKEQREDVQRIFDLRASKK